MSHWMGELGYDRKGVLQVRTYESNEEERVPDIRALMPSEDIKNLGRLGKDMASFLNTGIEEARKAISVCMEELA